MKKRKKKAWVSKWGVEKRSLHSPDGIKCGDSFILTQSCWTFFIPSSLTFSQHFFLFLLLPNHYSAFESKLSIDNISQCFPQELFVWKFSQQEKILNHFNVTHQNWLIKIIFKNPWQYFEGNLVFGRRDENSLTI